MQITENNIEKTLKYLDKLDDNKYENLVNSFIEEQAYLSTFVQQNLDALFSDNEDVIDFSYNLYFTILYLYKNKQADKYIITNDEKLVPILEKSNEVQHNQEELSDFVFTQLANSEVKKEDILKIVGLLNIVIACLE